MILFILVVALALLAFWLIMVLLTAKSGRNATLSAWTVLILSPLLVWHYATSADLYGDVMRVGLSIVWLFLGFENLRIILGRKPYLLKRRSEAS
ncbi:MAG: hypothetical protein AAGJ96_07535 [Pseudomonadota bacterium]